LQLAPLRRWYLAGITGWNFAEHIILNVLKRACLLKHLYSVYWVMGNVPQGRYLQLKSFDIKWLLLEVECR
jgi:hypothetical protein